MNTLQLKNRILDLAIHGKLVTQDPNDEPASLLLERIKEEKARLVREKKIKFGKSTDDLPLEAYQIPKGWVWCKSNDIAYVAAGSTPSKDSFVSEGIPYLKMYNLRNQKIDFNFRPQYIKEEVHNGKLARSRTEIGDLIMNIVGPPLGKLAFIPDNLPQANFNQAAVLIRPLMHKSIIGKYLFYYLNQMDEINSISTKGSAGQVNISLTQAQNMRIPLPPLAEQRRIVAEIEKWMKLVDIIESNQTGLRDNIDKTKAKILDKYISGHLTPFNNIAELISGRDLERSEFNNDKDGIPYITGASNVVNGHLIINRWTEYPKVVSNKGDILLSCKGTIGELVINTIGQIHIARQFMAIRPKNDIDIKYLYYAMKSIVFQIIKMSHGVIPGISRKDILGLSIPLPSINEQHRIVAKVEELFAALDKMRKCIVSS